MRRPYPTLLALASLLATTSLLTAQTPPTRIMPLGDSITFGSSVAGGYRNQLYQTLTSAGFNVDFVGTQTGNGVATLPDSDHEGHGGWIIGQLDTNIAGWLSSIPDPDVVLLHIGTNDFGTGTDTTRAIDRLDALITKIATLRPYAHIIVTNLMERNEPYNSQIQSLFNPYVQGRVDAQAALGRRVTFLDMRSYVPVSEMPDQLHPGQVGYNHMADAWLPAIQAVITPVGDASPPALVRASANPDRTHVAVTFSKPVADSAAAIQNFALTGGLIVSAASLDSSKRIVTLTTSQQTLGTSYTVTVNGVTDRIPGTPNPLASNSSVNFAAATPRGYLNNVPESAVYTLTCSLDVPTVSSFATAAVPYSVDNRARIGPFNRVAYYVELQPADGDLQYLWVSMNAFTNDVNKIAVPTTASGAVFQQGVSAMNVASNVPGITTGTNLSGHLEFWPTNYSAGNSAGVPGASSSVYDFGDTQTPTGTYGSMQVHNPSAAQTLFAFNNWGGTGNQGDADIGLGNDPAPVNGGVDWTFAHNGAAFTVKSIQVLVQTSGDLTGPSLVSASAAFGRTNVKVTFSEPLAAASVKAGNFSIDGGVTVLGATLAANQRDVLLTTTLQPAATPLTLSVSAVRDSSPSANPIAPGSSIAISSATLPAEILANTSVAAAASNYQLVYSLDIPATGSFNAAGPGIYSVDDRAAVGPFSRVAYYLELQKPGQPLQYVWTSMDAFAVTRAKIGVPTAATGAVFQQNVTNLQVISNVAGVVNGTTPAGGNIEFWPTDYSAPNAAAVPGASATTYDFGDTRNTAGTYGSMQIHNHDAGALQTVLALNHFGVDGQALDLGIGNNPAPVNNGVDWTFAANSGTYSRRVLHVLVLPGSTTPSAITANVPEAAGYQLVGTVNIPSVGNLNNANIYSGTARPTDAGSFDRIAYYLELKKPADAASSWIWTSMDAYTTDPARLGVPTTASGAVFQQNVTNLNVASNVSGIVTGTGIATGNIEFWPSNYAVAKSPLSPSNASDTAFDFGDSGGSSTAGHGSMQVHNYGASQTLFSITNWGTLNNTTNLFGLGIGNNPAPVSNGLDWTFAANSNSYDTRVLYIFVRPGVSDAAGPLITSIKGSTALNRLVVIFNEPVADTAAVAANFGVSGGITVTGATLQSGNREVVLTTSAQTPGTVYTITASGIRDRSPNGNLIAAGATATFTAFTPPAVLANVPEAADYKLIYRVAIPAAVPVWNVNAIPYTVDESKFGEQLFDRVAYLLELDGNWAYASFDPHTNTLSKVGIPTLGVSSTAFQRTVSHMNVASNVAGIVTGNDIATGNIEFWGGNYTQANGLGIPNANASAYDFGDTMTAGGHACLQIHNYDVDGAGAGTAGQTILALSNWGSNTTGSSEMGIGNNPNTAQAPDWTLTGNGGSYTTRNLYVLVHPGGTPVGAPPVLLSQPFSRMAAPGGATTLAVNVTGPGPFTYQWRFNGVPIQGATDPWLDLAGLTQAQGGSYDVIVTGPNLATTTSQAATVTVNSAPLFNGFNFTVEKDTSVTVLRSSLLSKASDAEGDPLSLTAASSTSQQGGSISLNANSITYTPLPAFLGSDAFTLTITDSKGAAVSGPVNITVTAAPIFPAGGSSIGGRGDGKIDLVFPGSTGAPYEIQRSINLSNWSTLQSRPVGDDGLVPFTDTNPPADRAFYRTRR